MKRAPLTYGQRIDLNLETILDVFEEIFGHSRIATRCLTELVIDERVNEEGEPASTLGVNKDGVIFVNRPFWDKFIQSRDDLKTVLMHELMHHITGDVYEMAKLDKKSPFFKIDKNCMNVAMDARINAFLHRYMDWSTGPFLDRTYEDDPSDFHALLHPESPRVRKREFPPDLRRIFDFLYHDKEHTDVITYRDIYDVLLRHIDPSKIQWVMVLGNHDPDIDPDDVQPQLPKELEEAAKDLIRDKTAGHSDNLRDMILDETQDTAKRIDSKIFRKLGFDHLFRNIRADIRRYREIASKSVIPKTLSRNDLFRIHMGFPPFMWDSKTKVPVRENICAPIYLDVSGSMIDHLPSICKLISNVDSGISHVWGFSNKVYQHDMEMLRTGNTKSTWGTDFNCVIAHAFENNFKHIILITDGYANSRYKADEVKTRIKEAIVIMTDDGTRRNFFSNTYGKTYSIAEVTI